MLGGGGQLRTATIAHRLAIVPIGVRRYTGGAATVTIPIAIVGVAVQGRAVGATLVTGIVAGAGVNVVIDGTPQTASVALAVASVIVEV